MYLHTHVLYIHVCVFIRKGGYIYMYILNLNEDIKNERQINGYKSEKESVRVCVRERICVCA